MLELAKQLTRETGLPETVIFQVVEAVVTYLAGTCPYPVSILLQLWFKGHISFADPEVNQFESWLLRAGRDRFPDELTH